LAVPRDQEFLEVPLDTLQSHNAGLTSLHPFPYRLHFVSIDIRFAQDFECNAVIYLAEGLDLVVVARVLTAKLIAGLSGERLAKGDGIWGVRGGRLYEADDFKIRVTLLEIFV